MQLFYWLAVNPIEHVLDPPVFRDHPLVPGVVVFN